MRPCKESGNQLHWGARGWPRVSGFGQVHPNQHGPGRRGGSEQPGPGPSNDANPGASGNLKKKKKFRNSRFLEHSPACPLPHPALRLLAIEEVRCQLFLKLERNLPEARECAAAADRNIALSCCQKARPSTQTWNSRVPFSFRPWVPRPISPRPGRGSGRRGLCSYFRFRIISQTPGGVPAPPPTPLPPRPPNSDLPRACCCPPPPLPNQRAQLPPPLRLAD